MTVTLIEGLLTSFKKPFFSRTLEITTYLSQSIKVFEDFKLMAETRQEIDKLNNVVKMTDFAN
ncbi:MAG TPA: hypothetical protein PLX95_02440 [bacterium]|nr:hypothetical protein [bacterium]